MLKVMVFIDGTWLYSNRPRLREEFGDPQMDIDYEKLPRVLAEKFSEQLGINSVDLVRTYLFGSVPANYDPRDEQLAERRREFFSILREDCHYEVETYPLDYRKNRIRQRDRTNTGVVFHEKCVDIALAANMLYYAAIPQAYDLAISVFGDRDYFPVLQHIRRLGKRVAIASIKGSCAREYLNPEDPHGIRDTETILLNDILNEICVIRQKEKLKCESLDHDGDPYVWTFYKPRKGKPFYCSECREKYAQKLRDLEESVSNVPTEDDGISLDNGEHVGAVVNLIIEKSYGFLKKGDNSYFFHQSDLSPDVEFEKLEKGAHLIFKVHREPTSEKAGKAVDVHDLVYRDEDGLDQADEDNGIDNGLY